MSVIEKVADTITNELCQDFADFLADHFGLDNFEVIDVVKDYLGQNAVYTNIYKPKKVKRPDVKPSTTGANMCPFVAKNGKKAGEICGTKIRKGGTYCSKHKDRKSVKKIA